MLVRTWVAALLIGAALLLCPEAGRASATAANTNATATTVTLRGAYVAFFAGHLVLDAQGGAYLDDGVYHITADRIVLDLRSNHYVAAGNVTVCSAACMHATAFGDDLSKNRALLVAFDPALNKTEWCSGQVCTAAGADPPDPLGLPDTQGEEPYAVSAGAVAHLGGDVRLQDARVVVPGSHTFFLPSYVFTYSTDSGYTLSNVPSTGEDFPIYIGSTRNSIQGLHFMYNPITKLGLGVDEHLVSSSRSYMLLSEAPVFGPNKVVNMTWLQQINAHTTQTFTSSTSAGIGSFNNYDLRDSVHRSFVELVGHQFHQIYGGTLAWQGFDQQIAPTGLGSLLSFHLRSEFGAFHNASLTPFFPFPSNAAMPHDIYRGALEGYVATRPLQLGRDDTLSFSFDDIQSHDTLPHSQTLQTYSATLQHRWNSHFTSGFSENIVPIHDFYPSVNAGVDTRLNSQNISAFYSNANAFQLSVSAIHNFAFSDNPGGISVQPWFLTADIRFRVARTLMLDVTRSYNFNYFGRRWSGFGFQILP